MRRTLTYIISLFCFISYSYAQEKTITNKRFSISANTSFKQENFNWSIAGNLQGQNPNVLSELIWENLRGPGIGVSLNINGWKQLLINTSFQRNYITSGSASDTDYQQDNRQSPSYQATLKSDQGNTTFFEASIGYKVLGDKKIRLTPSIGVSRAEQSLFLLSNETANSKLNSTYKTIWQGPYIGLESETKLLKQSNLKLKLSYYQLGYSAKADWNMVDAFAHPVSFEHEAKGYSIKTQITLDKAITKTIKIFLQGDLFYSITAAGTDHLYLVDGENLLTRINEVKRNGNEIGVGVNYIF